MENKEELIYQVQAQVPYDECDTNKAKQKQNYSNVQERNQLSK